MVIEMFSGLIIVLVIGAVLMTVAHARISDMDAACEYMDRVHQFKAQVERSSARSE